MKLRYFSTIRFMLCLGIHSLFAQENTMVTMPILQESEIIQTLQTALKTVKLAPEINLRKTARILQSHEITQNGLNNMIILLKNFAGSDNSQVITQDYFNSVINQKLDSQTPISLMYTLAVNKRAVAIHEAAHAVASLYLLPQYYVVTETTLFGNEKVGAYTQILRRFASKDHSNDLNFYEGMIMMSLAGGVADQIFNLPVMAGWYFAVDWLVGRKRDNSTGLDALLSKRDLYGDIDSALSCIQSIHHNILHRKDTIKGEENYTILQNYYEKTRQFVIDHKAEIEKLADLLVKKNTVFSDEIYGLFNMQVPLFDFEQ